MRSLKVLKTMIAMTTRRTRSGLGRFGIVTGITCAVLVASTGPARAQGRYADSLIHLSTNAAGGSRIGLSIDDVADNDVAAEGAMVRDVVPESPAASAGFADGDVIVEFDGERVRSASQLTRLVRETPAGRMVEVRVMRDGRSVELDVTPESSAVFSRGALTLDQLGDYVSRFVPDGPRNFTFAYSTRRARVRLGVDVQALSPQLADYFGVDDGVLVSSVEEESTAADAGLQAGDVITSVDGRSVEDSANLRRRLSAVAPGEEVSLGVTRAGRELELTATLDETRRRPR